MNWYALKTRNPFETSQTLRKRLGMDVYAPFVLKKAKPTRYQRARGERGSNRDAPAIGKYIFIRSANIQTDHFEISRVRGVLGLVGKISTGEPCVISQSEVDRMRKRFKNWHPNRDVMVGDLVDYCGYRVPIVEIHDGHAKIIFRALGRQHEQTLELEKLERAA